MESKLKPLLQVSLRPFEISEDPWYRAIRINERRIGSMPDQCLELGKMNSGGEEIEYAWRR
ncbi:Hypothetical predicted protein [Prunus dulcis]|uniref:Uncharacterized protein n=1 Tax=Prunus dulcis TaxID=3755 RepID=A0A5E4EAP5_PRUDU|nr:Hypothetical predicted protein [Prunus dulcis]